MAKSGGGHEPYIEIPINDKYFLSDKMIESFTNHKERHKEKGTGFQWQPKDGDDIANALRANAALCPTDNSIKVPSAIKKGYEESVVKQINPSKESGGQQPYQQNRVFDTNGLSPAVLANLGGERNHNILTNQYKIRRLTPLECFRLQGFPDEAFFRAEKVNSDTQLYKQAGNSITTCVMVELFKKIFL
jgi:DNA (cytosine-5)-methyltransferase 1